jgi:hypothetical protein
MGNRAVQINNQSFFGSSLSTNYVGIALAGGTVKFFEVGTSTPQAVYTASDKTGSTVTTVTLDSIGMMSTEVYFDGTLLIEVYDADGIKNYEFLDNTYYVDSFPLNTFTSATDYNSGALTAATINAAITDMGATVGTLLLKPGAWTIDANITVPSNIKLWIANGAILTVSTGITVAINGPMDVPISKVFVLNGTGLVTFGDGYIDYVTPQLWGAVADGSTDCEPFINQALTAFDKVYFPTGVYAIRNTLYFKSNQYIYGDGDSSTIKLDSGLSKNIFYPIGPFGTIATPNSYSVSDVTFKDICIDQNITDVAYFVEAIMTIVAMSTKHLIFNNVHFKNPSGDCVYICKQYGAEASTVIPYDVTVSGCRFSGTNINRNGISIITGHQIRIINNHFYQMTKDNMPGPIDLEPNEVAETIYNVCIEGNTFDGCKGGISTYITSTDFDDYDSIVNITIKGNNFYNQVVISPYVPESQTCITVANAKNVCVEGNNLYSPSDMGIVLAYSYGVICQGNNIFDAFLYGIRIEDIQKSKVDNNFILMPNDTAGGQACIGIDIDTTSLVVGDNYSFSYGSMCNNTIISTATTPTNNFGIVANGNVERLNISGIISGFSTGLFLGTRVSKGPDYCKFDLDISQNTTPFSSSYGAYTPVSLMGFNLGEDITCGQSAFSASTAKVLTGLPVRTTSLVRATRIGSTGLANTLTAACPSIGQITVTSSASESGSFIWEVIRY